jgi:glycosyltransferase involved in cell wall biosynthesis
MAAVDVVVPCYNYARFLPAAVGSILSQPGVDVRVLILDDCSTDDTPEVCRALAADPRVEYRRHATNRGHIATYNEGLAWLAAEYCLVLSADDMLAPGALFRACTVMDAHPEVGLTHGLSIWTPHPEHHAGPFVVTPEVTIQTGPEFIRSRCEAGHNLVEAPTTIGRTAVQRSVGDYRPELPHSGDMEMWLRYAAFGSVAMLNAHQAFYRTHGQNMSTNYRGARDLRHVKLAFDSFFACCGDRLPPGSEGWKQLAYRAIGDNAFVGAYEAFRLGEGGLFSEFVALAREVDPGTRFSAKWLRLKAKRLIGRGLWDRFRACRRCLHRNSPPAPPAPVTLSGARA